MQQPHRLSGATGVRKGLQQCCICVFDLSTGTVCAKSGEGIAELRDELATAAFSKTDAVDPFPSCTAGCSGCHFSIRYDWAQKVMRDSVSLPAEDSRKGFKFDRVLTHPVFGVLAFLVSMLIVFYMIFSSGVAPGRGLSNAI